MSAAPKIKNPLYDENFLKIMIEGTQKTMLLMANIEVTGKTPAGASIHEPRGYYGGH